MEAPNGERSHRGEIDNELDRQLDLDWSRAGPETFQYRNMLTVDVWLNLLLVVAYEGLHFLVARGVDRFALYGKVIDKRDMTDVSEDRMECF